MEKSYVSMEQKVCEVCWEVFDTGSILMDRRLENSMGHKTVTGMGLCQEHKKLFDDGYVALVEIDPEKSTINNGVVEFSGAWRTGNVAFIRREQANVMFDGKIGTRAMVFVQPELMDYLRKFLPSVEEVEK